VNLTIHFHIFLMCDKKGVFLHAPLRLQDIVIRHTVDLFIFAFPQINVTDRESCLALENTQCSTFDAEKAYSDRLFVVILNLSKQMLGQYLKIGHNFLNLSFVIILSFLIRRNTTFYTSGKREHAGR